ncbi:oxysterol-binding protein-related protein 1-like [Salvelinus fontinalis]|uniref:oxysterol-binding protein-related protein 1-like n=1 Tax=Salvelinus fontinalis TaxID=8038 RepID=UPI0024866213|nr:oxysterol-binding protein-related protein 1-like [Salvelinus fontinalis]
MDLSDPEEQLLHYAKTGSLSLIQCLLQLRIEQDLRLNINCRGKTKTSAGWTPLHLACYFGHKDVVEELLKAGADVNLQNSMGDTPLHKAALTGRKEVVLLLLRYDASSTIINGKAQIPKAVTEDDEINTMLEAAERRAERRQEEKLLEAAREGDIFSLSELLSKKRPPDIDCRDLQGNTPLHCAAYRGQKQCVGKLLKCGASSSMKNKSDQTVFDLACSEEIKQILEGSRDKDTVSGVQKFEGLLWKSSRFLAWRSHWVVIQDGVLSWYPRQADAVADVRKQGAKALMKAHCRVKAWDKCFFSLRCFDHSLHHFKVSSKTDPEAIRKRWLDALEEHTAYSSCNTTQEQTTEDEEGDEDTLGDLTDSLQTAEACQQKLETQVSIFLSMVKNEENNTLATPLLLKARETSDLSRETSSALHFCLGLFSKQQEVWSLKLEQEVEKNKLLSEALQTLATEHQELDQQSLCKGRRSSTLSTLTEDDFYDALSESDDEHSLSLSGFLSVAGHSCEEEEEEGEVKEEEREPSLFSSSTLRGPAAACDMSGEVNHGDKTAQCNGVKKHRTSLPAPMFSRNDVSIWSILKKCIGMELSKIAMPVIFNEPLSFLQRLTEYMEHTYLIHQANAATDSMERMKCVAAFAVSAVASQWERTGKPFNPLLGETYELIREDLGFRWMSEQVSHHPPVSAFHAEGLQEDFLFHGSIYPKLKFWGKSVEAEPKGIITLELPKYNEAYTWTNPTCCVHNIIVGQLWIEQYGNVEVINHKTGERCSLTFKPCGMFGKELHKVEGYILDKSKKKLCAIYGKWTECLYTVDAATFDAHKKSDKKNSEEKKSNKQTSVDEEPEEMPLPDGDTVQVIPGSELIWRIAPRPDNSAEFYAFSTFAMQLNELEEGMKGVLPPTDCRLRPDIRAMEKGDIDLASEEKKRVEEKQRLARKNRSKSTEEWKTRWFHQGSNPHIKAQDWLYSNGYWERNYSLLPDIY